MTEILWLCIHFRMCFKLRFSKLDEFEVIFRFATTREGEKRFSIDDEKFKKNLNFLQLF